MKELIVLLNRLTEVQEELKGMGVHIHVGLKPSGGNNKPQKSLAAKPMPSLTSPEKILETALAKAAGKKVSKSALVDEVRFQWNLTGPQIGQGLRRLVQHKLLKYDSVSGIYKIL